MQEPVFYRFRADESGTLKSFIVQGGTKDGQGAGDNDRPYPGFSRYQFTYQEYARLLLLRGRIQDARLSAAIGEEERPTIE